MWNLVVLYIGSILITLMCEIHTRPLQGIDDVTISNIFNDQLHQKKYYHAPKHQLSLENKSSDDAVDNEYKSHYGSLKSREILELIKQATYDKDVNDISSDYKELKDKKKDAAYKLHGFKDLDKHINKFKSGAKIPIDQSMIKPILSYLQNQVKPKKKARKPVVKPLNLASNLIKSLITHEKRTEPNSIDDYSKIYVILNPLAIQKSNNKDSLSDLISKLSSASFPKERGKARKVRRYKGFPVKENKFLRRARRDSKEKYDPKNSMEDYKPKRARNDRGGGRTAIPYIRHRGDIYERDN